jgi:hypothetical protein
VLRDVGSLRVLRLAVNNVRGFDEIEVIPREHVLLLGEPRAGRTDLLGALNLALAVDAPRNLGEFDFFEGNRSQPIVIEVTIGDLEPALQQRFLDELEFWNVDTRSLVEDLEDPSELPANVRGVICTVAVRMGQDGRLPLRGATC